jgi:hypothetical protein
MTVFKFVQLQSLVFTKFPHLSRYVLLMVCVAPIFSSCANTTAATTHFPDPLQPYMDASASKGTAVAAVATAEYFSMQLTATVESRNQIGTQWAASANALATERTWNATSTADSILATGTASAVAQKAIWTQRAMDITATADSAAVQAFATQQYAQARSNELSIQRKEMMNSVAAVVPWGMGVGALAIMLLVLVRWSRVRII